MTRTEGLVLRIDAKCCHVEVGNEVFLLTPRGKLFEQRGAAKHPVAVGDRVLVELDGQEGGSIEEVLPRRTKLARASAGEGTREQVLAANVDQVLIVSSIRDPLFRPLLVDRILAGAERGGMHACIVINKLDLESERAPKKKEILLAGGPEAVKSSSEWERYYHELGYPIFMCSAKDGTEIPELRERLRGHITVFSGLSGVGKSSLLNAIEPGLSLAVGKVSGRHREGKHTTTHSSLLRLSHGGHVVDTPGIRNFGLYGAAPEEIAPLFREFRSLLGTCAFNDCSHTHEPDCKVREAMEHQQIDSLRYRSYCELREDAAKGTL